MKVNLEYLTSTYYKYINELYSYGLSLGFEHNQCMDAIHDVFYKIALAESGLEHIGNIRLYLFRSIKNRLLDIRKKNKRLDLDDTSVHTFKVEVSFVDDMIDNEDREIIAGKIDKLMSTLSSHQREAVHLRYMLEMDYEDISKALNISPESARKLIYRSLEKMRERKLSILGFILLLHHLHYLHQ